MSGLSSTGFDTKRLEDIEDEIIVAVEAAFGPINQNDEGVLRQFIGIVSEREALLWELMQALYGAYYPSAAEAVSLDNVAELAGIERIAAAKSTAIIGAEGTAATVIPAGTQFSASATADVFDSDGAVTIQQSDSVRNVIEVTGVADSTLYRITIDAANYDYTSDASATSQEIVDGLIAALASGSAPMTGVDNGDTTSFTMTANDGQTGYNVSVSTGGGGATLAVNEIWSPVAVTALVAGEVLVNSGQIDTIVTPVSGLDQVAQFADGVQGREVETDAELRVRLTGVRLGEATVEAIRSRLLDEVDGVSVVLVIENTTDAPVGGQDAHSIHCVVEGGTEQDVAEKIWQLKPAGIATYGSISKTVVDGAGKNQTVKFSRPTSEYAWVKITYTKHDEETFPADGEAAIAASLLEYGNTFEIGQDLLWQRFLGPVFETSGVQSAQVELDTTPTAGGPPSYVTDTDVPVDLTALALFDAARITVTEAP
jgi:uncharacterized phage protein gp47/JayE